MTTHAMSSRLQRLGCLAFLCCLVVFAADVRAQPVEPKPAPPQQRLPVLTLQAALDYALENNPTLAAQRKQRGIAEARVVIAETYPFNPIVENRIQGASGPASAGITNSLPLEHIFVWEVEMRGQGKYRRQGAAAALSRTDWEIAHQEQTLAVQVIRFYAALLYRQEKLRLLDETLRVNERLVEDVRRLLNSPMSKLRPTDLMLAESAVIETTDLVASGRESLTAARRDLYRVLGIVDGTFEIEGPLTPPPWNCNAAALAELGLARRADLRAREMAVAESYANVHLTTANRYGNPSIGPAYTIDPSRVSQIGVQINVPLPLVNTRRGEVRQSQAEYQQAAALLREAEIKVRQDVAGALAQLDVAEKRAEWLRSKALPDLQQKVQNMEKLFLAGDPGADLLKLIELRRILLKARDSYFDALWSVHQARADVLAATGEPVLGLCNPAPR